MASRDLSHLLELVRSGKLAVEEAARQLSAQLSASGTVPSFDTGSVPSSGTAGALGLQSTAELVDLGYAQVDIDRQRRLGLPEVVFGEPKTAAQIIGVVRALADRGQNALVTRIDAERAALVLQELPRAVYHPSARCLTLTHETPSARFSRPVAVVTAGTGDLPVAEEAALTLELAGERVVRVADVGVAGLHRLLRALPRLEEASAIVCVAGMEGALPSVLGGLVRVPVVAVPTSVGYGVSTGGYAALLGMLSSCSAGVTVVNIDNGFGAAMAVLRYGEALVRERARGTE